MCNIVVIKSLKEKWWRWTSSHVCYEILPFAYGWGNVEQQDSWKGEEWNRLVWKFIFFAARTHKKKLFLSTTRLTTCVFEDVILLRFFFAIIHIYHGSFNSTNVSYAMLFFSGYMSFCEKTQRLYLQPMCSQTR